MLIVADFTDAMNKRLGRKTMLMAAATLRYAWHIDDNCE